MQTDNDWNLVSFGHGLFQDCILQPVLFQPGSSFSLENVFVINSDQSVIIGIEATPSPQYVGGHDNFVLHFEKNIAAVELGIQINLKSTFEDVSRELTHNDLISSNLDDNAEGRKKYVATSSGILIYFDVPLKISKQYVGCPLLVTLNLNLELSPVAPFKQRLKMDKNETNVRLLLDLNRYRPPRIPTRKVQVTLIIQQFMNITTSYTRELDLQSSLIAINIRNNHPSHSLKCHDICIHLERTIINTKAHEKNAKVERKILRQLSDKTTTSSTVLETEEESALTRQRTFSELQVKRTTNLTNNFHTYLRYHIMTTNSQQSVNTTEDTTCAVDSTDDVLIIAPGESFTIAYKIYSTHDNLNNLFTTPLTLSWSYIDMNDKNAGVTERDVHSYVSRDKQSASPVLYSMVQSDDIIELCTKLSQTNSSTDCAVSYEHLFDWSLGMRNTVIGMQQKLLIKKHTMPIHISIHGASRVFLSDGCLELSVSITNNSTSVIMSDTYLTTEGGQHSDGLVIIQVRVPVREIAPGESMIIPLNVLPLTKGIQVIGSISVCQVKHHMKGLSPRSVNSESLHGSDVVLATSNPYRVEVL